ncbi:hypothetical protein A2631_05160 [Candidatus Daviesbacteria bacterium RIFCSPHIGHO2_01_FULL_44_29]|uniref:NAD-dependent epimerase/dehydratase domain-containing protein n=1 Tax=Candidatus Daviesbacteria bacterium RIFCSPHIGHO2_02_FULL_43_12 TaxID=1797776 RepID=A0A1F5KGU8_9BACT|nr:MAG: hypothetical protein A2631_05160 [Candidatus Daviesbacteria bacterium RIFCSPHIGHO2_01_FULL_44_29]OGE40108.1 MAG: hypothetical protein A3D25_04880 [Candidatus Daviesbacteria bacterium RIFCSPHIGHO2_02_FULL_43_12]OGE41057.1 MAG: hypothetical protein A3E86_04985 [Candidatus Daviesbacteria bacterium RIFCSPHIGHO2_12_FULL_47_45]OGE70210.1 MAG: hypothetical protein A3B55_00680 [Candidatus Daviesbacteria bacterium RIFCSPLOWO2_01_FULL_43_15]
MPNLPNSLNRNSGILLSRNAPVAFVVGAAGFLGSHLVEHLLDKGIQVVGIDNFETGSKDYISEAIKDKDFHFLNESIISSVNPLGQSSIGQLQLPRLDYAFFVAEAPDNSLLLTKGLQNFLAFIKRNSEFSPDRRSIADRPRVAFVSSIKLYDTQDSDEDQALRGAEVHFAKFIKDYQLNARIVRLTDVFGPRMHFRGSDPITRLIQAALLGTLQRESTSLDFTTRAIYVGDAINLITKSVLAGGTAGKIFDGTLLHPLKVTEVKQILLDPMWHEMRGYSPTELPPWPTPNLERTRQDLSWDVHKRIIPALKETISYFKDNSIEVPALNESKSVFESPIWQGKSLAEVFEQKPTEDQEAKIEKPRQKGRVKESLKGWLFLLIGIGIIIFGLLWPFIELGVGVINIRQNLTASTTHLEVGNFEAAVEDINRIKLTLGTLEGTERSLSLFKQIPAVKAYLDKYEELLGLLQEGMSGVSFAVQGARSLYQVTKVISGEDKSDPKLFYIQAQTSLTTAYAKVSEVLIKLDNPQYQATFSKDFQVKLVEIILKLKNYQSLIDKSKTASELLPEITGLSGLKTYLVLIQDNQELRPSGGVAVSYAKVTFDQGHLAGIEVDDVSSLDEKLRESIEPPADLKSDLKLTRWTLRDSTYDSDFPTAAKVAGVFFTKEAGVKVNGVFALDTESLKELLQAVGGVDVVEYSTHIDQNNFISQGLQHRSTDNQLSPKSYITTVTAQLFNKIFFVSKQNWPEIIKTLSVSLDERHLLIYLSDPQLLSYAASVDWVGLVPRPAPERVGERADFLYVTEANMGQNKANAYVSRSLFLTTTIGKEGEIKHFLKLHYKNSSQTESEVEGSYKNRLRLFLPAGSRLIQSRYKDTNISTKVSSASDYGRSVYSTLLELAPKEEGDLIFEYTLPQPLDFKDQQAAYQLDILKQPGTLSDGLDWTLQFPTGLSVEGVDSSTKKDELTISTDLQQNRSFRVIFRK